VALGRNRIKEATMRFASWLGLLAAMLLVSTAGAQVDPGLLEGIKALRGGGHVIVFRHGATHSDQADTDPLNLNNVAQQRQLNDQGRALARAIGEAMHKLTIPVGTVETSLFNRAVETGTLLGFGAVTSSADISEGGLVVTPTENNRRAQALRKLAAGAPPAGTNVIVVTHKPNIMDAFGKDWFDVREGEASVFKPDGSGGYKLVVRVQAADWAKLAQQSMN
jgi:phosphohistidine phosphatase SixA